MRRNAAAADVELCIIITGSPRFTAPPPAACMCTQYRWPLAMLLFSYKLQAQTTYTTREADAASFAMWIIILGLKQTVFIALYMCGTIKRTKPPGRRHTARHCPPTLSFGTTLMFYEQLNQPSHTHAHSGVTREGSASGGTLHGVTPDLKFFLWLNLERTLD